MSERVCAVIATYNRKELLRECLQSVLSQTRLPDHILVVDNASTDGTQEMLKEESPQVEVLRLPENQGGAGGFHEGMKRAYEEGFDWLWHDLEYTARVLRRGVGLQVRDSEVIHKGAIKPYISASTGENRLFFEVRNRLWVLQSQAFGPFGKAFLYPQLLLGLASYLVLHPNRRSVSEIRRALVAGLNPPRM